MRRDFTLTRDSTLIASRLVFPEYWTGPESWNRLLKGFYRVFMTKSQQGNLGYFYNLRVIFITQVTLLTLSYPSGSQKTLNISQVFCLRPLWVSHTDFKVEPKTYSTQDDFGVGGDETRRKEMGQIGTPNTYPRTRPTRGLSYASGRSQVVSERSLRKTP